MIVTQGFHCQGPGFNAGWGTKILQASQCGQKKKEEGQTKFLKLQRIFSYGITSWLGVNWCLSLCSLMSMSKEKAMATHSSVPAWRMPRTGKPGGLPSMGLHRAGHDWSDLAAAAKGEGLHGFYLVCSPWYFAVSLNWFKKKTDKNIFPGTLQKEMATHSSILAWKSPWTEESGGLKSMGLHDWACVQEGGGRWVGSNKVVELKYIYIFPGTSLVVQWLRPQAPNAGGTGPSWGI